MVAAIDSPSAPAAHMRRWVLGTTAVAALGVVVALAMFTEGQARSGGLGAGIAFAASGYAVLRAFSSRDEGVGEVALALLYRAEFGKLLITGGLCAVAFSFIEDLAVGGFLIGLVTTLLASTLGAILAQTVYKETASRGL